MAQPTWAPVNDSESAMAEALRRGDSQAYFQALAAATLYLPAFNEPGPQQLVTVKSGEDTYLIVFTSAEGLARRLTGVDSFRTTSYPELRAKWPDPAWMLAVDPDSPIQGFMPIGIVSEGAAGRVVLPAVPEDVVPGDGFPATGQAPPGEGLSSASLDGVRPANQTERDMLDALRSADVDAVIRALVLAEVYLPTDRPVAGSATPGPDFPWRAADARTRTIPVFTSVGRLVDAVPRGTPSVALPFLDLALGWPGPAWRLVVNPGSELELTFPGEHVLGFVGWAEELVHGPAVHRSPDDTAGSGPRGLPGLRDVPGPRDTAESHEMPEPRRPTVDIARAAVVSPEPVVVSPEPVGAVPVEVPQKPAEVLQKIVPHRQVESYLHGHWSQVSGPVHRYAELRDPCTPAELHAATGGAGGVFQADDPSVHVIRWTADCPGLYRPFPPATDAGPGEAPVAMLSTHAVTLPHGAQLHRLDRDAGPRWLASYDADVQQWVPAPEPGLLRQALIA